LASLCRGGLRDPSKHVLERTLVINGILPELRALLPPCHVRVAQFPAVTPAAPVIMRAARPRERPAVLFRPRNEKKDLLK
jgi:hypothetical protein